MVIKEVREYNPKELEQRIRKFWEKNIIPQKLTMYNPKKKKFYLLDGPPYVNQIAHVGHIKTTTIKDIWSKFKLMQGFTSWFQPGFDCHGLPIENMVEKELGITSKKQIEEMGVDKFIEACRKHAEGNEREWLELYRLLGAWRGYVKPYITLKNYYIESAWWSVKKMFEKGMLIEGVKSVFWCPHCSTALAGYEVTDSYADVRDPYIYVKFPIEGKQNEFIVIATTTPWTLVGNVAIAVHPEEYYVRVKVGEETLILSEKTVEKVLKELCKIDYQIQEKFLGKTLEGIRYLPVLDAPIQKKLKQQKNAHRIILSIPVLKSKSYKHGIIERAKEQKEYFFDFVVVEEGTGCVHCAPGHGPEDHYVGEHYKLPAVSPVDEEGKFTSEAGEFQGIFVKDADKIIVEKLEKKGLLLHSTWITHAYPLCWRCKSPLIYRLSKQWFFTVDTIKEKMLKENKKVNWLPEFGRERFHKWLEDAVDWCISRQRYWGIPLPVWICGKCGKREVIGSVKELREKSNKKLPKRLDLHKHTVDKVELTCSNCNSSMKRVPDIMDVWFDSGISPWASLGYPFQNKDLFEKLWPCDAIAESQDQIRGWFYSLMFCGVATFDTSPFKKVGLMGWVLDERGEKMSKSLGNVIWGREALEKLGADILRLYYCWEVAPWEVQKFSFKVAEEVRRILNILWSCYTFFTIYGSDFKLSRKKLPMKIEDRWILSRVNTLVAEVTIHLENFEFHLAGRDIANFVVEDLSHYYIKLIRDRVWITEKGLDKQVALSTLYHVLTTLSRLLAPITPFIAEEIHQNLARNVAKAPESVYLCSWPIARPEFIDGRLDEQMEIVKKVIEACYSARQKAKLKLRWPVRRVWIVTRDSKTRKAVKDLNEVVMKMCNAKEVNLIFKKPKGEFAEAKFDYGMVFVDKKLDEKLLEEALIKELIRKIQEMRKKFGFHVKESILLTLNSDEETNKILERYVKELKKEVGAKKVVIGKIEGKYKGSLSFGKKEIEIRFSEV